MTVELSESAARDLWSLAAVQRNPLLREAKKELAVALGVSCPCGCDISMDDPDYARQHGDAA